MTGVERRWRRIAGWAVIPMLILIGILAAPGPRPDLGPGSRFMRVVPDGITRADPFGMDDPGRYLLIVYLPGSTSEPKPDRCDTSRPGINVPRTATDLAGITLGGYEILVYAFCTPTTIGGFNQTDGDGIPKVVRRADELEKLLDHIAARGFPPERLFVMGQSAGAWAGLLVQRNGVAPYAGLIAFAPAFAGFHGRRTEPWQTERDRQVAYISEAPRIDALVFGYEQDRYEPVRAMTWLAGMPGVTYTALTGVTIDGIDCGGKYVHGTVFKDCFRKTQYRRILDFIVGRLPSAGS